MKNLLIALMLFTSFCSLAQTKVPYVDYKGHIYYQNKQNVLLLKTGSIYEPIYYLEGDGKYASKKCLFTSELIEIKKLQNQICPIVSSHRTTIQQYKSIRRNLPQLPLFLSNLR